MKASSYPKPYSLDSMSVDKPYSLDSSQDESYVAFRLAYHLPHYRFDGDFYTTAIVTFRRGKIKWYRVSNQLIDNLAALRQTPNT